MRLAGLLTALLIGELIHAGPRPAGLQWGDTVASALPALRQHCASVRHVHVDPPSFPLAAAQECHVVCETLRADADQPVTKAAFVFADNALVMIEVRGGAAAAFGKGEGSNYMHYSIHDDGERWLSSEDDTVWFLSEAARHPNLFAFRNPFLDEEKIKPKYRHSAALPDLIDFTRPLQLMKEQFKAECPLLYAEQTRVWLPHKPNFQAQVNCFGLEYAGFPRKFEVIYGDDKLEVVWILTGKPEEARIRAALIDAFGPAEHVNERWEIFADFRVALRKDKPEVLLLSADMVPHYRDELLHPSIED